MDGESGIGWGAIAGEKWAQGCWNSLDITKHMNWKELRAYQLALESLGVYLRNKLVYVKCDNIAAVHYINYGRGRISELCALAR